MRDRNRGYERQEQNFYPTPAWVTEALLRTVRLPKGIWEPCCGNGAMARVLEAHGHHVVGTDLVDRGYGEGGRDVLMESRLPDGVTAIVTNPPYGRTLLPRFVDHALELTRPVGGMVALLVNVQWQTSAENSKRLRMPAFDASVILTDRIRFIPDTKERPGENHCWLVWDWSRTPGRAGLMFADPDAESEPETRWCIVCRKPLPLMARADARLCSDKCRQRAKRNGMTQRRTA
jgi:predicted nucleic acid-binding Zn ribbon protein